MQIVGCCLGVLDVEQVAQGGSQRGGELGPAVRCADRQDAESAHSPLKQGICAVYCCGGRDGDCLRPVGGSVNNCEQMGLCPLEGLGPR